MFERGVQEIIFILLNKRILITFIWRNCKMSAKIVLVTGGARSGKSRFAEEYVRKLNAKTAYFATAQIFDEEMRDRIFLHQSQRPAEWTTYETPFKAWTELRHAAGRFEAVLFDCLTIYTSNLLLSPDMPDDRELRQKEILDDAEKLMKTAKTGDAVIVFVTNEVGFGIVPDNALAREFRDIAGLVNQKAALFADEVYLVVCGLPVRIK
jgi:adenosylcobinamide kinase/adenosylcobinamide-phosphate guanylyltransferase